jgi:hypothetical protein
MFFDFINEAILKTLFLFIRFFQIFCSLFIVGATSRFANDVTNEDKSISDAYIAVIAIGCVAAAWTMFTSLITCCGGSIFFNIDLVLDFLVGACFVASAVLLRTDGRARCKSFNQKYFGGSNNDDYTDCNLIKAVYAISIVNMYANSSVPLRFFGSAAILTKTFSRFLFLFTILISVTLLAYRNRRHHHHKHHHEGSNDVERYHHHHHSHHGHH